MEKKTYIIPKNYSSFFSSWEMISGKNLIEAVVVTLFLSKGISYIPFVRMVKIGATLILGGICFIVFLVGYNDESIITFLQGYLTHKISSGIRRIRIPEKK